MGAIGLTSSLWSYGESVIADTHSGTVGQWHDMPVITTAGYRTH